MATTWPRNARHVTRRDFERFDWVIAMDAGHHDQLRRLCPPQHTHKLRRAADFSARVPLRAQSGQYHRIARHVRALPCRCLL
jgi:protein-tyrosine phosphatase